MTIWHRTCAFLLCFAVCLTVFPPTADAGAPQGGAEERLSRQPAEEQPAADEPTGGFVPPQPGADSVQAAGVIPSTLFDPDSIAWASGRDYSSSAFSDYFNQMKTDYMMIDIEVDEFNGQQKVGAVWQWNTDNRGWAEHRNLSSSAFHDKWVEYRDKGYRLIDQEAYTLNGVRKYAGVWVQNKEGLGWASYRNLTSSQFSEKFKEFKDKGYIIIDVEGYSTSDGLRYAMVWVQNTEGLGWAEYRNMSSAEFAAKFDELKGSYRVWDIESYRHNGVQYYAGIWVKNTNGRGWAEYRDMSETGWRNRWYRMRDLGYRLVDFETYSNGSAQRYAGVWRQNNDRPDWSLRSDVDTLVQDYLDTNNLPGIGVAIAQGGQIKYMRGFGYQDVNDNVWYSARTINRLASVSKAVAGVLTMELLEDGALNNLDDATASYVASMPDHHTHTLRQLLANRGGIGHYSAYSVPIAAYNTALAAAQTFWNTDSDPNTPGTQLVYTPGAGCIYSTHSLTILGAALEGATGKSIGDLVEDELSTPLGLATLQKEDRSDGDANRATLYNSSNNESSADDISWKVLGGGLEASAYDLVRFGMKVLNGSIISEASRNTMWSVPSPVSCTDPNWGSLANYALGWQVGTQSGTQVVWKGGNQNGANTAIRMYPDEEIVIVVLANRNPGHNTGSLASQLGGLLLSNQTSAPAGIDFGSLAHFVIGQAHIFRNDAGNLVINNFGSSGKDGVQTRLKQHALWSAALRLTFTRNQRRVPALLLKGIAGSRQGSEPTLSLQSSAEGMKLTPSFAQYRLQYLNGREIVFERTVPQGKPGAVIPWSAAWCLLDRKGQVPEAQCDVSIQLFQNRKGAMEWRIGLDKPVSVVDGEGQKQEWNRLRIMDASGARRGLAATFTAVELTGAGLDDLTIRQVQAGGPEDIPEEPSAPSQIFLPLLQRR